MVPAMERALLAAIPALLDRKLLVFREMCKQAVFLFPLLIHPLRVPQYFSQGIPFDPKMNLTWKLTSNDVPK